MNSEKTTVANWGNYPVVQAEIITPEDLESARRVVAQQDRIIARGNGKCYGDAALGACILSTLKLKKIINFDTQQGLIECESGVLLAELLPAIVPKGWFFHVTPGIKNITVGGAIASDVHGKNHREKGCFSNWLQSFELLLGNGEIITCSKTENADLFWQTCGGMGWTGIVLSATFQLMPISSTVMLQKTVRPKNLDGLFDAFESFEDWPYAAAWVDCLSFGHEFGRGVCYFARHAAKQTDQQVLRYSEKKSRNIPFFAPSWLLNNLSIRAHNWILFNRAKTGEQIVGMDKYFYPLDAIRNWNRLYGRRGFIQYQFCLPEETSRTGIAKILEAIQRSSNLPFLSVLKRHGERPAEAINSFPIKGYSLALDFPRTRTVFSLVTKLDELVWNLGGKVYLTKDACSNAKMGRVDPRSFGDDKFHSLLKERLLMR